MLITDSFLLTRFYRLLRDINRVPRWIDTPTNTFQIGGPRPRKMKVSVSQHIPEISSFVAGISTLSNFMSTRHRKNAFDCMEQHVNLIPSHWQAVGTLSSGCVDSELTRWRAKSPPSFMTTFEFLPNDLFKFHRRALKLLKQSVFHRNQHL